MKIIELVDDVLFGTKVENADLSTKITPYFFLQENNIRSGKITEEDGRYVIEKSYKKNYTTAPQLLYGDILVYINDKKEVNFFRFEGLDKKKVIASYPQIIIKYPNALLSIILQQKRGRDYFIQELNSVWAKSDNKNNEFNNEFIRQLKNIDVDQSVIEDLRGYIPPGNMPISQEEAKHIRVESRLINVSDILENLKVEIKLEGYFQRKTGLWSHGVKSRLIETIMVGIPIPPLFFDIDEAERWLVIDGLQRLTAIKEFCNNQWPLIELDYRPEWEGKYFKDFERPLERRFLLRQLNYFAIFPGTPRSVRYKIFKNVNTSSLNLNRQEIRHAINEDEMLEITPSKYIMQVAEVLNKHLSLPEKGTEKSKERMYDRELALRFISTQLPISYIQEYKSPIQDFLDKSMEGIYQCPQNKKDIFKKDLNQILTTLYQIFTPDTLFTRRMFDEDETKTVSGMLFEVWTYIFSQKSIEEHRILIDRKNQLIEETKKLMANDGFRKSIDSRFMDSQESVKTRFTTLDNLIKSILNVK